MANSYKAIYWNKDKKRYDRYIVLFCLTFLFLFILLNLLFRPEISTATLLIRAFGILAIVLLHIVLAIGPLCRINPIFLPLLYNRRHLGVITFLVAMIHGFVSIIHFHGFGDEIPVISVFTSNTEYSSFIDFPFQTLGFVALMILLFMAATSHDFWLKQLGPKTWKTLHMLVYVAYFLVVMHVVLGALQDERSFFLVTIILVGVVAISGLHIYAATISVSPSLAVSQWVKVGSVNDLGIDQGMTISIESRKIAIFRYSDKLSAVSNYCRHQGGPLGEGKIIDGCITCPWHGYQYFPHNGCSPPPYSEKLETYDLKLQGKNIYVNPVPHPPGTNVEPITISNNL